LFENTLRQEQRTQSLTRAALVVRKYSASRAKGAKPDQNCTRYAKILGVKSKERKACQNCTRYAKILGVKNKERKA